MEFNLLAAFWLLTFSLVMTPGADWVYAISAGMRDRAIIPAVCGMLLGYAMITVVVAAGVGALVAAVPTVLTILTLLGASYLLFLGIGVLRNPPAPTEATESEGTWRSWLIRGFAVSGINPKALLLFLALLPQFTIQTASWPISIQIAALGMIQIVNCGIVYLLVGFGSRHVLKTRPNVARVVSRTSGIIMIAIALLLLAEALFK